MINPEQENRIIHAVPTSEVACSTWESLQYISSTLSLVAFGTIFETIYKGETISRSYLEQADDSKELLPRFFIIVCKGIAIIPNSANCLSTNIV